MAERTKTLDIKITENQYEELEELVERGEYTSRMNSLENYYVKNLMISFLTFMKKPKETEKNTFPLECMVSQEDSNELRCIFSSECSKYLDCSSEDERKYTSTIVVFHKRENKSNKKKKEITIRSVFCRLR